MVNHVLLCANRCRARYDVPEREFLRIEHVGCEVEPFLFAEFRKQGNEFLECRLWMNGNDILRIDLQGELNAVGVFKWLGWV